MAILYFACADIDGELELRFDDSMAVWGQASVHWHSNSFRRNEAPNSRVAEHLSHLAPLVQGGVADR
jgi:hypothetical protein